MHIYRCKQPYLSGLMAEPAPHWLRDYELVGELDQVGTGKEALEAAFEKSQGAMNPGDAVGLDDGTLWRCEVEGWTDIGKLWVARVQKSREWARSAVRR
jgi:hypothetical protein